VSSMNMRWASTQICRQFPMSFMSNSRITHAADPL
jgi:hypothetical protein